MKYQCVFSEDRAHRFVLMNRWDELFRPDHGIAWIGLNPSTADEISLDPTLQRIESFSKKWGYSFFVMLNAFSYRATRPKDMKTCVEPNHSENDTVDRVLGGKGRSRHACLGRRRI